MLASIAGFVAMPRHRWSKRRVVSRGAVVIRRFCHFEAGDPVRSSMNALACVIRMTRISMGGRGKVVRNAAIFGHHKIINSMRRTQLIGLDIERKREAERCQKGPNPEH